MPVATKIWCVLRNDHQMADSGGDEAVTARADVLLASLIRLNWIHYLWFELATRRNHPRKPHATKASVSSTKPTTRAMSSADLS